MRKKQYNIILVFLLMFCLFFLNKGYSKQGKSSYILGVKAAKSGNLGFAYMYFRDFLRNFPESELAKDALFALGEYYFAINDNSDAVRYFNQFVEDYPECKTKIFALGYLMEIARKEGEHNLLKKLEKELVVFQKLSFLFRDFKEYTYVSPLSKKYKVVYFIDKIEIYIDENSFAQVAY